MLVQALLVGAAGLAGWEWLKARGATNAAAAPTGRAAVPPSQADPSGVAPSIAGHVIPTPPQFTRKQIEGAWRTNKAGEGRVWWSVLAGVPWPDARGLWRSKGGQLYQFRDCGGNAIGQAGYMPAAVSGDGSRPASTATANPSRPSRCPAAWRRSPRPRSLACTRRDRGKRPRRSCTGRKLPGARRRRRVPTRARSLGGSRKPPRRWSARPARSRRRWARRRAPARRHRSRAPRPGCNGGERRWRERGGRRRGGHRRGARVRRPDPSFLMPARLSGYAVDHGVKHATWVKSEATTLLVDGDDRTLAASTSPASGTTSAARSGTRSWRSNSPIVCNLAPVRRRGRCDRSDVRRSRAHHHRSLRLARLGPPRGRDLRGRVAEQDADARAVRVLVGAPDVAKPERARRGALVMKSETIDKL